MKKIVLIISLGLTFICGANIALNVNGLVDKDIQSFRQTIEPTQSAILVVDMWNYHWCKTFTNRINNMIPRMNRTLDAARKLGIKVIFAPSDIINYYEDCPQREKLKRNSNSTANEFRLPFLGDGCECGPTQPCKIKPVIPNRKVIQHPDLTIKDEDFILDCDNADELFDFCANNKINTLIYMGVASNMCILARPCGIKNMKQHGFNILFVSDLVEALTANGLNRLRVEINDENFTPAKGTYITQKYIEYHWAPSFASTQLITIAGLNPHSNDHRPHIVFISAEKQYQSETTLPQFAVNYLGDKVRTTFLQAEAHIGKRKNFIKGLEALYDADLLVLSMHHRALPAEQMDHIERFVRSGKPLAIICSSMSPFYVKRKNCPSGHVIWKDFDREILKISYSKREQTIGEELDNTNASVVYHPRMPYISLDDFPTKLSPYRISPLSSTIELLLISECTVDRPSEPLAFTNIVDGKTIFYTSLGSPTDFQNNSFCQMLKKVLLWMLHITID